MSKPHYWAFLQSRQIGQRRAIQEMGVGEGGQLRDLNRTERQVEADKLRHTAPSEGEVGEGGIDAVEAGREREGVEV